MKARLDIATGCATEFFHCRCKARSTDLKAHILFERAQPGGADMPVTAFNKEEYVSLYIHHYFYEQCCVSFDAFREGFSRVVHQSRYGRTLRSVCSAYIVL